MPSTRTTWKTSARRTTTGKRYGTTTRPTNTTSYNPKQYNKYRESIQAKIGSYKTLNQQFTGAGKVTAFSPTNANKWIKYVDQGTLIYKFNNQQFMNFWGATWNEPTPTAACRYLKNKYGAGIKAVTRGKGNNWLVAATPRVTARPFSNYTWK